MYKFVSLLISDVMFLFSGSTSCLFIIASVDRCCFLIWNVFFLLLVVFLFFYLAAVLVGWIILLLLLVLQNDFVFGADFIPVCDCLVH